MIIGHWSVIISGEIHSALSFVTLTPYRYCSYPFEGGMGPGRGVRHHPG